MLRRGHARRMFAGSNSASGFHSFFAELLDAGAERVFVIKGGPGAGKSTFMKRIAETLLANGIDVDLLHCSSDSRSIDGFLAPAIGVIMIDGTAPHVLDPKHPGAVDEIIDLGQFADQALLATVRSQIVDLAHRNRQFYRHAFNALAAAQIFLRDIEQHVARSGAIAVPALKTLAVDLAKEILEGAQPRSRAAMERRRFASAITPDGFRNYLDTIFHPLKRRYIVRGHWGTGKHVLLQRLHNELLYHGFDIEAYYCALDPNRLEHLTVPELGIGIITSSLPHIYEPRSDDVVMDTAQVTDAGALAGIGDDLRSSREMYGQSLELAVTWLARAKQVYGDIEQLYAPHQNFQAIDELRTETMARIRDIARRRGLLVTPAPAGAG